MPSQRRLDTFYKAATVDLDLYSLLVACGGDGTYHEVLNGMLARPDGRRIPFGMIPNGSGNDTCSSMGIFTLDHALDYIVNRTVTPIDTVRCLVDYENESDVPNNQEDKLKFCRHMVINGCVSLPALINSEA